MRVDARDQRYANRFAVIDASTGLRSTLEAIYADDEEHVLGFRSLADVLRGDFRISEVRVPRVVIDLDRDVILYNVLEGLAERSEASREEALA